MILTAALTALAASASAGEASWVRAENLAIPAIHPSTTEAPGPLLTCSEGRYGLVIALDSGDFAVLLEDRSKRVRKVSGVLMVGGEATYEGPFAFKPSTGTAQAAERKPAAQVFNAVVRGDEVVFSLSGRGEVVLSLPPVDDVFSGFASECAAAARA